jgi:general secretion pathway protein D
MKKLTIFLGVSALAMVAVRAQVVQAPAVVPAITPIPAQIPFGQVLDVIPYVSADGYSVQMHIIPTLTEFLGYDTENARQFQTVVGSQPLQPQPLPKFRVRQVTTSAIVWDGQTVVLGGLIAENVSKSRQKIPVLGDVPLLGRLFRSESSSSTKKNLVIFVTPTIIDPSGNRVHSPDSLPYDPNTIPEQKTPLTTTTTTAPAMPSK